MTDQENREAGCHYSANTRAFNFPRAIFIADFCLLSIYHKAWKLVELRPGL